MVSIREFRANSMIIIIPILLIIICLPKDHFLEEMVLIHPCFLVIIICKETITIMVSIVGSLFKFLNHSGNKILLTVQCLLTKTEIIMQVYIVLLSHHSMPIFTRAQLLVFTNRTITTIWPSNNKTKL